MAIEICTVGGYNEVGKNCTAIKVDEEVIIIDMGIHLENYIRYTQDEDVYGVTASELIKAGAIPDISKIQDWRKKVKAIIPTHAHLDHLGAIPYLANKFDAEILCTPFTKAVLKTILHDEKIRLRNPIKSLSPNAIYTISDKIKIEFINMTHSTPQTVMIAVHTPYGIILYCNDFKFDSFPTLGKKPNFKRLKKIGEKGVLALICDSTYSATKAKTPSESVAKEMLKEVMLGTESKGKLIIVTTFSSHLARLKSIIEFGKILKRKILFLGRSLSKYVKAGEDINIINFSKDVKIFKFRNQIKGQLKKVEKNPGKYLLVITGHQGEPKAVLSRITKGEFPYKLQQEDHVIFSCKTIPTKISEKNREKLENSLKNQGVRIFKDVHVSGHAAREDQRDLINMVKPEHIIPAHGNPEMKEELANLAFEMGYKPKKVHIQLDGQMLSL